MASFISGPEEVFLDGPVGQLEALYGSAVGVDSPRAASVVCHPHPLHGGTMHNTVAFRTARALREAGIAVLRFNFRGVGQSAGEHDGAGGEIDDAAAGLDWLAERFPGVPLMAAGFSFGARTASALAMRDPRVERLVCVALPVRVFECGPIDELLQPSFFLFAGDDEFGNLSELHSSYPTLPKTIETSEIPGTDHFFRRKTPVLEARIKAYAEATWKEPAVTQKTPQENQPEPTYPDGRMPSIRRVMMPRDANALGTIFGGVILSEIDLAAAIEAHKLRDGKLVTVAMDKVEFHRPVFIGDLVSFFTSTERVGTTSVTVRVSVWAERRFTHRNKVHVTDACVTMVAVDDEFNKVPIGSSNGG